MTQHGNVGEIWRFDPPPWDKREGINHYLILSVEHRGDGKLYNPIHYHCIHLETGLEVPDLLIDDANLKHYNARRVA